MEYLLRKFKIQYETLDSQLLIYATTPEFWASLELPFPGAPQLVTDVFPELFGMEDELYRVLLSDDAEFSIAAIQRGNRYMNLSVVSNAFSETDGEPLTKIVLHDVTDEMNVYQSLMEGKTEINRLTDKLELRNRELSAANERLDNLMNLIRSRNHDLDIQVKQRTRELQESRLSAITTLARMAEFRDMDTGAHVYRIGRSSVLIGRRLGLDSDECEILYYATLLHDVGKIGIPDSILMKPGPLNPDERTLMQKHTLIGAEFLESNAHRFFKAARNVALCHHERWDGKGYPNKLAKEKIPLMARICTVVDVFDALVSERCYKQAWDTERAVAYISEQSGKQFDPEVVRAFIQVLDRIMMLQRQSKEDVELLEPEFG